MRFSKGNTHGQKSSRRGIRNKVNKEALITLVNACVTDLNNNFDKLKTYEKIKLITAFQNIYRDQLTDLNDQAGTIPKVIFIDVKKTNPNE